MAEKRKIVFVTGNANKLKEVRAILAQGAELPVEIESRSVDVDEMQGTTAEVAIAKCARAAELTRLPTLTEDTALAFHALGGLPGPYIKHFLAAVGGEGLNKMLDGFREVEIDDEGNIIRDENDQPKEKGKEAEAICTFAFCTGPGQPVQLFEGRTLGRIVQPRGPGVFGWDNTFQPNEGGGRTYAEMPAAEKNLISHRYRALEKLREYLVTL
ncbi:Ham1-like protein [Mucidula mucida]|nr:Ham1-like protein [Mucidula mucida]